ncbi:CaiB/BaiF CoA transferase family protein [Chloroflexota bacterium]
MEESGLRDIRVLDLCRTAPGAFCTMILGDLGAEVYKVETPYSGDTPIFGSGVSPLPGKDGKERGAYSSLNRNKKSIALDLKSEEGRQIFYSLARKSDVIVEGFRPGVTGRLKVDYETIKGINPAIICCSMSGYGQDGPYRDLPGHDINYISIAGALGMIGSSGQAPAIPMNFIADYAGGSLFAVIGVLAAIVARQNTGAGQYVDIAMTDGAISLLSRLASDYFKDGLIPKRGEQELNGGAPYYNVYETRDGKYVSVGCLEPVFWENLCRAFNLEELIPFQHAEGTKREEIFARLKEAFLTRTRDEWFEILKEKNVCVAPVYELDETFSDPQALHRQMVIGVTHPELGEVKQVGSPIKFSAGSPEVRSTAPFLGEHTDSILLELGYKARDIKSLREAKIIQ